MVGGNKRVLIWEASYEVGTSENRVHIKFRMPHDKSPDSTDCGWNLGVVEYTVLALIVRNPEIFKRKKLFSFHADVFRSGI